MKRDLNSGKNHKTKASFYIFFAFIYIFINIIKITLKLIICCNQNLDYSIKTNLILFLSIFIFFYLRKPIF